MPGKAWTPTPLAGWTPGLGALGLDIWRIPLALPADEVARRATVLDAEERARADRFAGEAERRRYVLAHAALRDLLERYAGISAGALRFVHGPRGKPALAGRADLSFNLSHADELALLAVTRGRRVGVDVEAVRPIEDALAVARHFFAPGERVALTATPRDERDLAFLRCWTRKEAFVKAIGTGISARLDAFEVGVAPDDTALRLPKDDPAFAGGWTLIHLDPAAGYVGAAAVDGPVDAPVTRHLVHRAPA